MAAPSFRTDFVKYMLDAQVLSFGQFTTKAGRTSPYFFNSGRLSQGSVLAQVARYYAQTLLDAGIPFDMLFGPAYKGITLASATAMALAGCGRDVPFAYNRKEVKAHGEGGTLVGAPLAGRVVIVDDVISAGTSARESIGLIRAAGATPVAVLIALDRMERSGTATDIGPRSATQDLADEFGLPVVSIASLDDVLDYLALGGSEALAAHRAAVEDYRRRYGASA